ncbi:hypothetical protein HMPREF1139_1988 [Campylobacter sp. FOBRC14]|nr:hypothetical protein HMPREF1139_1988 [Campylobacter sp. FOBRC14]
MYLYVDVYANGNLKRKYITKNINFAKFSKPAGRKIWLNLTPVSSLGDVLAEVFHRNFL